MNILSATAYQYERLFENKKRKGLLLQLKSKNGKESWGEIAPLDGFSKESFEKATDELVHELPHLLCSKWHPKNISPSVHFGIESAILELMLPTKPKPILVNALLNGSADDIYLQAKKLQHYKAIKIKVGHLDIKAAISLIKELLTFLPKDLLIRIDPNQSWLYEQAMHFARSFPPNTFEYFEEPFASFEDYTSFPYPIALDETIRQLPSDAFFSLPYLYALIIKPTLIGGCTKLIPLLKQAKQKNIAFILSSSYESELGIGLLAKVAYRLQLPEIPMGLDTYHLFKEKLFQETIEKEQGKLIFPNKWKLTSGSIIAHEYL